MTQCGWNNWRMISGALFDKSIPPHVKGKIHKMIVQPAKLHDMETVSMTSSHVNQLEVTETKMSRWAAELPDAIGMRPYTIRDIVRYYNIRDRLKEEKYHREVQENETVLVLDT